MFGIRYMKSPPTTFVIQYKDGKVRREGAGLSFFYYAPTSTLVCVPLASSDVPFVFHETTGDFQALAIQGQLTYRVSDARRVASLLDYSLDAAGQHSSDDPEKLQQRLVHATQVFVRGVTSRMNLRQALAGSAGIVAEAFQKLKASEDVAMLGVEIMGLSILAIQPTPEMSRALEAEAREALQRNSDEAIYARRKAAVEQERTIKESELNTELAVEAKRREIREAQMAAEIAVETQRASLIEQRVENEKKDAIAKAFALEASLKPLRDMDWRTLMVVSGGDARTHIAAAFLELATNAQKIGTLNVTPDLLQTLLGPAEKQVINKK